MKHPQGRFLFGQFPGTRTANQTDVPVSAPPSLPTRYGTGRNGMSMPCPHDRWGKTANHLGDTVGQDPAAPPRPLGFVVDLKAAARTPRDSLVQTHEQRIQSVQAKL